MEGFDRVVGKFQELNLSVQNMSNEYSVILQDATGTGCNHFHPTVINLCICYTYYIMDDAVLLLFRRFHIILNNIDQSSA